MDVNKQEITNNYALYNGDCIEVMRKLPDNSVDMTIYSPPFATDKGGCLYTYSSDPRDMSNSLDKGEFFEHYKFCVKEISRITKPGRMSCVHCMDVPSGNSGCDRIYDYPGDIIRLHDEMGMALAMRFFIWKEPLTVRNRTMTKSLSHRGITEDSTRCSNAVADQLLVFRNKGENAIPVVHPNGFTRYVGQRQMPAEIQQYRGWEGSQLENRFSHWIWRHYASAFWDDIRIDNTLPYRECKGEDDERHVHPLQLDVIERACEMWTNPGEVVLTPFMGVGSECYGAVKCGRKAIGIELKAAYYNQAVKNMGKVENDNSEQELFPLDLADTTMD